MLKNVLSKNWISTAYTQQNMKRAFPVSPAISNYHIITQTTERPSNYKCKFEQHVIQLRSPNYGAL